MEEQRAAAYRAAKAARDEFQARLDARLAGNDAAARAVSAEWEPVRDRYRIWVSDDTDTTEDRNRADRA